MTTRSPQGEPDESGPDVFETGVPVATVWTDPQAPRAVDAAALLDHPDPAGWAASMGAEVRKGLGGRTLTQLLMGERVRVLEDRGGWVKVLAPMQPSSLHPAGYPGWVRGAHLSAPVRQESRTSAAVVTRSAPCRTEDGARVELSFGTWLPVASLDERSVVVLLPGHHVGTMAPEHVELLPRSGPGPSGDDLLGFARLFLGLRYLWGGTSAWGLDCSGLVHLVYRALGVVVPRDAHDQADAVTPVPLDEVRPGDLYFFARPGEPAYHVGFITRPVESDGTRWMLHAPEAGGELVEDAPLAPHRSASLVSAGRVPGTVVFSRPEASAGL